MRSIICIYSRKIVLLTCLVFITKVSAACINFFGEVQLKDYNEALYTERNVHGLKVNVVVETVLKDLLRDAKKSGISKSKSAENLGNYAVLLLLDKQYEESKIILRKLMSRPEDFVKSKSEQEINTVRYLSAANLGTLYELEGKPDSALYWIKYALQLNHQAHGGSEWIHRTILEEKVASDSMDREFNPFQSIQVKIDAKNLSTIELNRMKGHLKIQLQERIKFVEAPDKVVSYMLFTLGEIHRALGESMEAEECYQFSKEYGFADNELLEDRIKNTGSGSFGNGNAKYLYTFLLVSLLLAAYLMYRRQKKSSIQNDGK